MCEQIDLSAALCQTCGEHIDLMLLSFFMDHGGGHTTNFVSRAKEIPRARNSMYFKSSSIPTLYISSLSFAHTFAATVLGIFFFVLYKMKIPYFEKMRVNQVIYFISFFYFIFNFFFFTTKIYKNL